MTRYLIGTDIGTSGTKTIIDMKIYIKSFIINGYKECMEM